VPAVSGFVPATRKIVQGQKFSGHQAASDSFLFHQERERNEICCTTFLFIYPNTHLQTLHKRLYCCSPTPFPSFCLSRFKILAHERSVPPHHVARDFWVKSFSFVAFPSRDTFSHTQILVCVYINQYRCHCTVALCYSMMLHTCTAIAHILYTSAVSRYASTKYVRTIMND
jgi:hypothetical protein